MKVFLYSAMGAIACIATYTFYWTQWGEPDQISRLPWIAVLILGLGLCELVIYLLVVRTHSIKKLSVGGPEQHVHE